MAKTYAELKANAGPATRTAMATAVETATRKAEQAIEKILLGLERDTMKSIDAVSVDTRNFGQLATEIYLSDKQRQ